MNKTTAKLLDEAGLNWKVRMETVKTESDIIIPKTFAIVREDINKVLSIRSDGYYPYQNEQLMELLQKVSDKSGLAIHNGGEFGDGKKVFIQLKSNDLKLGKDRIEGYVTGINSFDGSTSLGFGNSNVTISCQNTFFRAYREVQSKVRHTKNMEVKVDEILARIDVALSEEKILFANIRKMNNVAMDDDVRQLVIRALFDIDEKLDINDEEEISTKTWNKMVKFEEDLDGEVAQKGETLWGLFSGVTKYTTHHLSDKDNTEAKLFGVYGNRERAIFDTLVEYTN